MSTSAAEIAPGIPPERRVYAVWIMGVLPVLHHLVITEWSEVLAIPAAVLLLGGCGQLLAMALERIGFRRAHAGMGAFVIQLWFCFFGPLQDNAYKHAMGTWIWPLTRQPVTLPLSLVLLGGALWWLRNTRRSMNRGANFANICVAAAALLALPTFLDRAYGVHLQRKAYAPEFTPGTNGPRPDVYFILLDSHTSDSALREFWKTNMTETLDFLRSRGFLVLTNARSEYTFTHLSVGSTFSMNRLPLSMDERHSAMRLASERIIEHSTVPRQFARLGYQLVNLAPFNIHDQPRAYSWVERRYGALATVFKDTLVGRLRERQENQEWDRRDVGATNLMILQRLKDLPPPQPARPPLFVYAHPMMPHPPFVFDENGGRRTHANAGEFYADSVNKDSYLGQLRYTDKLLQETIDAILRKYTTPPVIIIQGDHGFRRIIGANNDREAHSILSAMLIPESLASQVAPDHRTVNTFRILFTGLYGAQYPLLPNSGQEGKP